MVAGGEAASGNEMHGVLNGMMPEQRAPVFAGLLNRIGEACLTVTRTFFQGFDKRGAAYWSVTCAAGKSLRVSLSDENNGTVRAWNCEIVHRLPLKTACFTKF